MFDQSDRVYDRWKDDLYDLSDDAFLVRYGKTKRASVASVAPTRLTGASDVSGTGA